MSMRQALDSIVAAAGAVALALVVATSPVHARARQPFTSQQMKNVEPVAVPADADTAPKPPAVTTAQNQSLGTSPKTPQAPDTQRISDIDNEHANVTGAELTAPDFPGLSFAIPGTSARIGIVGLVKLDAIADLSGVGDKHEFILGKFQLQQRRSFWASFRPADRDVRAV